MASEEQQTTTPGLVATSVTPPPPPQTDEFGWGNKQEKQQSKNNKQINQAKQSTHSPTVDKVTKEQIVEDFLIKEVRIIKEQEITMTQPGSIKYLMYGSEPSDQSLSIRMGKVGEKMIKKIISETKDLQLLKCGVQCINQKSGKNKDLDLIWLDNINKTIYYRVAKGNLELDSEKLPATIDKIKEIIDTYISPTYPDYKIDIAIFHWSVYNRNMLKKGVSQIKNCESKGIIVQHPEDLFKILKFNWNEEYYYDFFRKLGKISRE